MKKLAIVALAVSLAMPALSHAGSATSKWDMTIGGFVLMFMGWADQEVGSDAEGLRSGGPVAVKTREMNSVTSSRTLRDG